MLRISEARMASNGRIADVRVEVSRALLAVVERHPDLTYEELLAALLDVAQQQVGHLLKAGLPEEEHR